MNWLTISLFEKFGWAKEIRPFETKKATAKLERAA
jgi:fatty-acid desaturase